MIGALARQVADQTSIQALSTFFTHIPRPLNGHRSTWAYLSSYIYQQPRPESQKSQKSAQIATPGSQNLALERRNGPNPIDRSIGMPMCAHETTTEDKCDCSWEYLSSYIYITSSAQNLENARKSAQIATPGSQNLAPEQ